MGGITPKGEINMNFFLERVPLPKSVFHEIRDGSIVGPEIRRDPDEKLLIRYVTTGVVLNYGDAKSIHEWLGSRLKEFEDKFNLTEVKENDIQ